MTSCDPRQSFLTGRGSDATVTPEALEARHSPDSQARWPFSRAAQILWVAAALLLTALPAQADVYQYIDANGTISLTNARMIRDTAESSRNCLARAASFPTVNWNRLLRDIPEPIGSTRP